MKLKLHLVTCGTVFLNSEGCFTIMASTTRLPFFHLCHSDLGLAPSRVEQCCMALTTLIKTCVIFVTESDIAGIFIGKDEFLDGVTLGAGCQRESFFAIMACPT